MVTGHVFIATSLDVFVARMDHSIDWLVKQKTEGQDLGYEDFIASVDGLIMGRGSFKNILTFGDWPYQKPVFVMSKSLTQNDVPQALTESVRVTQLDPQELMESLTKDGWSRVYVDGGQVVQSFIRAGLIEDMTITLIPILIGNGRQLFGQIDGDIDLELLGADAFKSGLVQNRYRLLSSNDGG